SRRLRTILGQLNPSAGRSPRRSWCIRELFRPVSEGNHVAAKPHSCGKALPALVVADHGGRLAGPGVVGLRRPLTCRLRSCPGSYRSRNGHNGRDGAGRETGERSGRRREEGSEGGGNGRGRRAGGEKAIAKKAGCRESAARP